MRESDTKEAETRTLRRHRPLRRLRVDWLLAVVAFAAAAVLVHPRYDSIDAATMGQVAENILHHGTPLVRLDFPASVIRTFRLGTPYASYGLGMSLVWVPFLAVAQLAGLSPLALVALVGPLLLGLTAFAIYGLSEALGASRRQATMVTVALVYGTFLFTYGTTYYSEPAVACCVAWALLALVRLDGSWRWGAVLGFCLGFSVLVRTDSAPLVLLPFVVALAVRRTPRRTWMLVIAGALPELVVWAWYDLARYGSLFSSGYSNTGQGFTHPFGDGLVGLLVSPGKGFVWFAPVVILAVMATAASWRRWPLPTLLAWVLVVGRILFYSSWWAWDGGLSFGPRFLVPAVPALGVMLTSWVMDSDRNRRRMALALGLVVIGSLLALLGAVSFGSWGTNAPAGSWHSAPVVIVLNAHLH
jgi:hypothetical protein